MREFIVFCVFIGITFIIGLFSILADSLFDNVDGTPRYMLAWIISTVISSASITGLMVIIGLL